MQRHSAVDDTPSGWMFQHIFNVISRPAGGSLWEVHTLHRRPNLSLCCSMGGRPPSLLLYPHLFLIVNPCCYLFLCPVTTTHSHGPSIFGPPFGKPGLSDAKVTVIFSRNSSKGERSEMLLRSTASHVKLVSPASGEASDMSLCERSIHFKLVNPARGDISDISLW